MKEYNNNQSDYNNAHSNVHNNADHQTDYNNSNSHNNANNQTNYNNAQERHTCWLARDFYLHCLNSSITAEVLYSTLITEKVNETDSILPKSLIQPQCSKLQSEMFEKCPKSWAEHFEKKFRADKLKEYQISKLKAQGAQPL